MARRKPDVQQILHLYSLGYSSNKIDEITGFSHGVSSRCLRKHGISPGKGVTVKHEVECSRCGGKFETDNANRTICESCRATYDHPTAKCARCGKEFEKMFRKHRYCSKECRKADERLKARGCRELVTYEHECQVCGSKFVNNRKETAYCSDECRNYKPIRIVECCWCGKVFETDRNGKRYCSQRCIQRAAHKRRDARLRTQEPYVDDISLRALYDRDCGVCQICGELTDWDDCTYNENGIFIAGPKYPTHDHIVPVSKGGKHTWGNAQLACSECNTRKSASMPTGANEVDDGADDGNHAGRHASGTAEGAGAGNRGVNRRRGRVAQHGAARQAVPRDNPRDRRAGSGKR